MSSAAGRAFDPSNWKEHYAGVKARLASPPAPEALPAPKIHRQQLRVIDAVTRLEREQERKARREQERLDRIIDKCRIATAFMPNPKAVVARIKQECAIKHGIAASEIDGMRRAAPIVAARQEAMWRVKNETKLSYPEIGRRFGDKDHTTVIWAVRQHEARMAGTKLRRVPGAKFSLASTQEPTP